MLLQLKQKVIQPVSNSSVGTALMIAVTLASGLAGCATQSLHNAEDRIEVIQNLADALEENFVFPEIGRIYAEHLRTDGLNGLDRTQTSEDFARAITADLQSIHKDSHLRILPPAQETETPTPQSSKANVGLPPAIEATHWLSASVAYIRFNLFPGDQKTLSALDTFIADHANAKVLIVDIRGHRGGGLAELDVLFSHLFSQQTNLLFMETRKAVDEAGASPVTDSKTVHTINSPPGVVRRKHIAVPTTSPLLLDTELYVLTSGYTASAAEHLALSMKRTRRGTIVGEHTRGGAHFGGTVELSGGYAAFIPVGRTFDPDTGEDWEGDGVMPDIKVSANSALVIALLEVWHE